MTTVEVRDGRPALVREGADELRHEAATLTAIAGPGVPQVLELHDDGQRVRLVTDVAPPLAVPPAALVGVAAQLAAVLVRAHGAGITHGPIADEHVRGSADAVVLGGWGCAGVTGDPADDVAAVGAYLARIAGVDRRAQVLAARATAPGRPTMAGLLEALRAAAPPPGSRRWNPPRRVAVGITLPIALVAGGLTFGMLGTGSSQAASPPAASRPAPPPTTAPATTSTTSALAWPAPQATVDGNVVARNGARWAVGRPGDVVVVGDWDCDGEASPAVLRPTTGEVWLFAGWRADAAPEAGRSIGTVPGGVQAQVRADGRCDLLEVLDAEGQATVVVE